MKDENNLEKKSDMRINNIQDDYSDIINLPHHVSRKRPQMPLATRAAQFLPFAALTGYDAAVEETARLTDSRMELDEMRKEELNEKLLMLQACLPQQPAVRITFFKKDEKKTGGAYLSAVGNLKKIEQPENILVLTNGTKVPVDDVIELESEVFTMFETRD